MRSASPATTAGPSRSGSRIVATTMCPRDAIARDAAAPNPRDAPVIITICAVMPGRWCHIGSVGRLLQRLDGGGRVAVLRGADQRAGRSPRRCVKTGDPTDGATHVRAVALDRAGALQVLLGSGLTRLAAVALRRPSMDVVVAVSPLAWRRWQRALMVPITIGAAGAGLVVVGIATGAAPAIVFGAVFLVGSWLLRMRAARRWWVGVRYRPDRDEVVVSRVSAGFDDGARDLFVRSVTPHR